MYNNKILYVGVTSFTYFFVYRCEHACVYARACIHCVCAFVCVNVCVCVRVCVCVCACQMVWQNCDSCCHYVLGVYWFFQFDGSLAPDHM